VYRLVSLLALGLLGLAACDDSPQTNVTFQVDDVWSFVQGAMKDAPLPIEIHGTPYGLSDSALEEATLAAVTSAVTWFANPRFAAQTTAAAAHPIRIVMTFNGTSGIGSRDQCRGLAEGGGPLDQGRVHVVATLCDGEDVLANVRGRIGASDSLSDGRFSHLIRQVARDLLSSSQRP
jgi:hypothetical protein